MYDFYNYNFFNSHSTSTNLGVETEKKVYFLLQNRIIYNKYSLFHNPLLYTVYTKYVTKGNYETG